MNIKLSRLFLLLLLPTIVTVSQSGPEETVGLPEILKEINTAKLTNVVTISFFDYDIYTVQSRPVVSFERKETEEGGDDVNNRGTLSIEEAKRLSALFVDYQLEFLDSNSTLMALLKGIIIKRRAAPEANALVSNGDQAQNVPLD